MSRTRKLKVISEKLRRQSKALFRKSKQTFDYNSDTLINWIVRKTNNYSKNISDGVLTSEAYRTIAAIGMLPAEKKSLNVIDFGGGAGVHFRVSRKAFPEKEFQWLVIETPNMVNACKNESSDKIFFASTIEESSNFFPDPDLIFMNASIHYSGNPVAILKSLCALRAKWMFITRTPLSDSQTILRLFQESKLSKNGPGQSMEVFEDFKVVVPIQVVPKELFESILSERYAIILTFEEESIYIDSQVPNQKTFGYFCELIQ